jgi:serine/threonine-protein kinase
MNVSEATHGETLPLDDRRQIDAACDRFEAAWRGGERPDLAAFLAGAEGDARQDLFEELLALDREFRRAAGELPDDGWYRERFPEFRDVIEDTFARSGSDPLTIRARRLRDTDATRIRTEGEPVWPGPVEDTFGALHAAGYEVVEELGRGGMGVVYRAYQVALNRHVALKVIRSAGFASEAERRRFQSEAEAVAQLDHPHIIPVFEVGESRGLHYFSMRLISGSSLDKRRDGYARDVRAAAGLVATVAEAIQHAHQRGILHRDLKPANILVDDRGEPYVTDFGLARRVESDGDLTQTGVIVGTPSYMSPEQTTGGKGTLTTATDVYGLGAILYALLTGRAPHAGSSFVETLDLIREVMPEPPSKLNPRVPRDLNIICLKCLEKDPRRRYASAQDLAEDLRRWLSGEPIGARPVGPSTRAWMWCRRHPLPAALGMLLAFSLLVGFAGVTWKWRQADRERSNTAASLEFLGRMLAGSFGEANPLGTQLTVLQMLDRASARIGGDLQGQPEVEAPIQAKIGAIYRSLGRFKEGERHLRAALRLDTEVNGSEDATTLRDVNALAALLDESGRPDEAEPLLRRNLETCRRVLGPENPTTLDAAAGLGAVLRKQKRLAEAERLLRSTLDARRRVLPADHPDTLRSIRDLFLLQLDRGRFSAAEALAYEYEHGIQCAFGPKDPENVTALTNRGRIRLLQGKPAEAEPYYRQAVEQARRILTPDHPLLRTAEDDHARVLGDLGRGRRPEGAGAEIPGDPSAR